MEPPAQSIGTDIAGTVVPAGRLVSVEPLTGGVSAQTTAPTVQRPDGSMMRVVVRVHGDADYRLNPTIAATMFALLRAVCKAGLPAPQPLYLDTSGEQFGRPFPVTDFLPLWPHSGPAVDDDRLTQMATGLARIHALQAADPAFAQLPQMSTAVSGRLADRQSTTAVVQSEARLRAVLEAVWPLPTNNPPTLLHGDYWPGNLLWRNGRLSAILDWKDAQRGDPLADLAQARLEILWAFGNLALETFTDHYLAHTLWTREICRIGTPGPL